MDALHQGLPVTLPLWDEPAPLAGDDHPGLPRLTVYLPSQEHRTGQAIIICPGGGYGMLSMHKEGHRIARFVSSHGHAGAVLEYRHAPFRHPVPLIDAQRAIRLVRHHATSWELNPEQVGILGFSAGGHLAASAATMPPVEEALVGDSIDKQESRPSFAVPVYPVISLTDSYAHRGSRDNLLGDQTDDEALAKDLSPDQRVTADTPPCLLIHTNEDSAVPPENSVAFYQAMRKHHRPVEMHIYETGPHGIGLAQSHPWGSTLIGWLKGRL